MIKLGRNLLGIIHLKAKPFKIFIQGLNIYKNIQIRTVHALQPDLSKT